MITQEQISDLVNDVSYLADEAEALTYVIDSVPYDKQPAPGEWSVIETLAFLDHAQQSYYRKVIEDVISENRPININAYTKPGDDFEAEPDQLEDVQKVLYKISKHRAALINLIKDRPPIDWEKMITTGKNQISLFEFTNNMVKEERSILKEIAGLILAHQNDRQAQRELEKRHPG